jgi:hypothetical protein
MIRLGLFFAALLSLFVSVDAAKADKRVALVVGNSTYQNVPQLPNPVNDANAIAAMFSKAGFEVVSTKTNVSNIEFKRALREFTLAARGADIAVIFYAGHGIEVRGTNYLIPVDAKLASDYDAEDEAVSLTRIMDSLETAKRLRLVILDACRDNPFNTKMQRTLAMRATNAGLAKVEPTTTDTLIAFAAKAGSTAADGTDANSPFTAALLKHLTSPGRDVRIAFGHVRDEVMRNTGNKQEPFVYGSLGGTSLALVPDKAPAVAASSTTAAPTDPNAAMRRDYEFAERVGTKEGWDYFLSTYSKGYYANLAHAQRNKLVAEEARVAAQSKSGAPAKQDATANAASKDSRVALLTPPAAPADVDTKTTRALQTELKRVGCYAGDVDDSWTPKARQSLERFNKHANLRLDAKVASVDALDAVKDKPSRVCPLECGARQVEKNGACVAKNCPRGQSLDSSGHCYSPRRAADRAPRERAPREPRASRETVERQPAVPMIRTRDWEDPMRIK